MSTLKAYIAAILLFLPIMMQQSNAQGTVIEGIDRTQRPQAGAPPKIAFPAYETFALKNGLKVFLVHDPRPSVTMRLLIRGGNARDGEKTGLADASADLLTKGAGGLSANDFADQIDFIGGNINAAASPDAVSVVASGLKKNLPNLLDLFSKTVLSPAYSQDEIDKYMSLQVDALKANKKEGEFLVTYAINKVLYGDRLPLGRMPSEQSLSSITRDDIVRYHDTFFVPANATIAVVGDLKKEEVKTMLDKAFGSWANKGPKPASTPKVPWSGGGRIVLVDRPAAVQSLVRVVGPGPDFTDPERPKTFLLNSVIGGGTGLGNRLAMNLRETHAYTYTPYSYFNATEFGGVFVAAADVRNEVTDSAVTEMIREIRRMQIEPVPAPELDLNIKSAVGGYLMSLANPTTTAVRVQSIDFYGLPADYYDKLVAAYSSTTSNDLIRLAGKYFRKEDMNLVVVGKADEVKGKLEQFGKVEVWDENLEPAQQMSASDVGMTADEVWGKMLKAMGGAENLKKVKSIAQEGAGTLSFGPQKLDSKIRMTQAYPNKMYQELSVQGVPAQQQYVDGKNAVVIQQGSKAPVSPEEQAKMLAGSHILQEAWVSDLGGTLMLKGKKKVEGKDVFVIDLSIPNAGTQTYFLDAATYLPVRMENEGSGTVYLGWKDVDGGIKQPTGFKVELGPGAELNVPAISYTINGSIDDKVFQAN